MDWTQFAIENVEDDQDQKSDDEDSRDAKDERDERESTEFEKDFLSSFVAMKVSAADLQEWRMALVQAMREPHLETIVPPPRLIG